LSDYWISTLRALVSSKLAEESSQPIVSDEGRAVVFHVAARLKVEPQGGKMVGWLGTF